MGDLKAVCGATGAVQTDRGAGDVESVTGDHDVLDSLVGIPRAGRFPEHDPVALAALDAVTRDGPAQRAVHGRGGERRSPAVSGDHPVCGTAHHVVQDPHLVAVLLHHDVPAIAREGVVPDDPGAGEPPGAVAQQHPGLGQRPDRDVVVLEHVVP